jgi:deoxycytidine triphosphate deaminase
MTLLAGSALDPKRFFSNGSPKAQGSSFDLTIGRIFDHQGKQVVGPFTIKPGHMVQVVSSEELNLSDRFTGHVTYKTTMTRQGIWALTVGIVDPGWQGPIATTLLNFSRIDHSIAEGDAFLRVSVFEHEPVSADRLRKAPALDTYIKDIQKIAASRFPITFLDTTQIAEEAGKAVINRIRSEALPWVVGIALLFTMLQVVASLFSGSGKPTMSKVDALSDKVEVLQTKLLKLEVPSPGAPSSAPAPASPGAAAPAASPGPSPAPAVSPPNSERH